MFWAKNLAKTEIPEAKNRKQDIKTTFFGPKFCGAET